MSKRSEGPKRWVIRTWSGQWVYKAGAGKDSIGFTSFLKYAKKFAHSKAAFHFKNHASYIGNPQDSCAAIMLFEEAEILEIIDE